MSQHVNPDARKVPGLEFFPGPHRYRKDGLWVPHSVTQVLSFDMSPSKREAIERTKDGPNGWEARGNAVHSALDQYLSAMKLQNGHGVIYDDRWADWIDPLLDHPIFKGVEVLATEYAVYDKQKNCAGSFDFLLRTTSSEDKRVILGDLKTVSSKKSFSGPKASRRAVGCLPVNAGVSPTIALGDRLGDRGLWTRRDSHPQHGREDRLDPLGEAWGRYSVTLPSW